MRANEFITEVFQQGKKNWEWLRRGSEEANAQFKVGDREYRWDAFTQRANPKKWEIQFRLIRTLDDDPDLDLFGQTGTGNSTEVLSTAVDIIRSFLEYYGLEKVEEITFNAKEDSRIGLYAKMIKRLLPDWDLYSRKDPENGMQFTLTDRRAYDKPENKLNELFDPKAGYELKWDDSFGPKEIHARAYDRQGQYIDINFVPVRDNVTDIEFSKMDSFDLTKANKGDEVAVFATIMNAIRKYLEGYQPKIIVFSGKGEKRGSLYQRMVQKFANQFGYKQFDTSKLSPQAQQQIGSSGSNVFVLRRLSNPVTERNNGNRWIGNEIYREIGDEGIDEGVVDWAKKGAAAGAIALGALGAGNADAKIKPIHPVQKSAIVQPAKHSAPEEYNALSHNINNEITLQKAAKRAGMKGAELAQFLAQMKHESWDFERMKEKAQPGVKDYFAKRYDMKYSPKTARILGNKQVGDGAKYHGRGFVQLTGRDNYRMAGEALGLDLLKNPELASKPEIAAKIAVWYWQTRVKPGIQNFADTKAVTQKINPAMRGVDSRHANFKDYLRII